MSLFRFGWIALALSTANSAILPSLPIDDPSTPLLDRLDGSAGCHLPPRRPWPGEVVVACIDSLLTSPDVDASDKARLSRLRDRLSLRDTSGSRIWRFRQGDDLVSFDVGASIHAHAVDRKVAVGPTLSDSIDGDILAGLRVRPRVDVAIGPDIVLWARPRQIVEVADQPRWLKASDPERGIYQTALFAGTGETGRARTNDWVEGGIELATRIGRISAGLGPLEWGDLPVEPLMLSGNTESVPFAQATKRIGPIEATLLGGRLIGDTWSRRRYLYAHRFAWNGRDWRFGWSEMILSVEHDLEPLYLVPVFPYVFTEHVLGDPDNKQMDFDASWRPVPGLELSAELFLDDLQNYFGFLSDKWGNKWALGLGIKASGWTGAGSLDRIQLVRTEPWVGTASSSILPGMPGNAPVHFGKTLGSAAGPNSATLAWMHRQDLSEEWSWEAGVLALWKGTGPGSSIHDRNWRDSSGTWVVGVERKEWLSGDLFDRQELTAGAEWRFAHGWRATASASVARESLPGRESEWKPGASFVLAYHE